MRPEDYPSLYDAMCAGKIRFPSEGAAMGFIHEGLKPKSRAKRAVDLRDEAFGLRAYRCRFHEPGEKPHWHTGHE